MHSFPVVVVRDAEMAGLEPTSLEFVDHHSTTIIKFELVTFNLPSSIIIIMLELDHPEQVFLEIRSKVSDVMKASTKATQPRHPLIV